MKRRGGTIHFWMKLNCPQEEQRSVDVIVGVLVNDWAWDDEIPFRTSAIVHHDVSAGIVETLNSVYTLGREAERDQWPDLIKHYRKTFFLPKQDWEIEE